MHVGSSMMVYLLTLLPHTREVLGSNLLDDFFCACIVFFPTHADKDNCILLALR